MENAIPVYVLNGFLGSGKTTVLMNILSYCKQKNLKAGVILNELGESNVEEHLLESEKIVELLNGCICCTIQDDLRSTLDEFLHTQKESPIDLLLIEGTGVANPIEVIEALTDPTYIDTFQLQSIIGIVDASQFLDYQSIFTSSKEVRKLLKDQIQYSNYLLLNKVDLVSASKLEKVEKLLNKAISHNITIVKTTHANLDIEELLTERFTTIISNGEKHMCNHGPGETCSHEHHQGNHSAIKAIKLEVQKPINRIQLEKWLNDLPKEVFRGKGIIQLEESAGFFDFQYASRRFVIKRVKDPKVSSSIVIIGMGFNEENLVSSFNEMFKRAVV
ncbi:CobW family GTP-binding protein [Bacillus salitolerans]|uniref:CobW family GTP-binding protein n=1 Tax=Bacillus salitolerans TaxID=1437434 RepID=A0ABW4LVV2_9BACI